MIGSIKILKTYTIKPEYTGAYKFAYAYPSTRKVSRTPFSQKC